MIGLLAKSSASSRRPSADTARACNSHDGFVMGLCRGLLLVTAVFLLHPVVASAQDSGDARVQRTQAVLVSSLDPALPEVRLDAWLQRVVGPAARYMWTSGACAGRREDNPAVPLCGIVAVTRADISITIGVRLGEYLQDAKSDRAGTPRFDEAYISRGREVVMLDRLGDLARMLSLRAGGVAAARDRARGDSLPAGTSPASPASTCSMTVVNDGRGDVVRPRLRRRADGVQHRRRRGPQGAGGRAPDAPNDVRIARRRGRGDFSRHRAQRPEALSPRERARRVGADTRRRPDTPYDLLDWKDDTNSPKAIVSARVGTTGRPSAVDVPVDTSISRLVISVESVAGVTTTLVRPGGGLVRDGDRDVTVSEIQSLDVKAADQGGPDGLHHRPPAAGRVEG